MADPVVHRIDSSDGVEIVAYDYGGQGEPLLFAHATGFHGRYWDPVCSELSDSFRCITLDLRGHGDSKVPLGVGMEWSGMARDLLSVIEAFDLSPVRAVGHSMGGCAIALAELTHPGEVAGAWLFEPIIIPPDPADTIAPESNVMAEAALRRREVFESRTEAYDRYRSRPPFSLVDPQALWAYVEHGFDDLESGDVILKCRRDTEADVFSNSRTEVFARLGEIGAPIVVGGSGDGDRPALMARDVAESLPRGTFEHYPDLTHFAPMEAPARVAASIRVAFGVS